MIQEGTKLGKDVPPYVMAAKDPNSYVWINSVGLRRRGYTNEQITQIQDIYRIIFQSKLITTNAINKVLETISESPERELIIDFIKSSDRGIIKGFI